jgi:hypothetical protein
MESLPQLLKRTEATTLRTSPNANREPKTHSSISHDRHLAAVTLECGSQIRHVTLGGEDGVADPCAISFAVSVPEVF